MQIHSEAIGTTILKQCSKASGGPGGGVQLVVVFLSRTCYCIRYFLL